MKLVDHRIGDRRIVHLIQKWLKVGVLEEGERIRSEMGTVQGGSISPLLVNVYLHYVFDLWTHRWRTAGFRGPLSGGIALGQANVSKISDYCSLDWMPSSEWIDSRLSLLGGDAS